ncbi:hypothetical protein E8E11_006155 [Didymella keratinophila]|nr:hypothetical protein E8E11_006155 [Didymella keratinophila]
MMEKVHRTECANLIENVCEKSLGVFLWTVLVVRSLIEGLIEGDNIKDLQVRVDNLPDDLEELFWGILKTLDSRSFPRACRLFKVHRYSERPLTLLDLSFVEIDAGKWDFALDTPLEVWDITDSDNKADLMKRHMTAYCKGLLEASQIDPSHSSTAIVGYFHRTVRDFLEQSHVSSEVETAAGPDFDHSAALCDIHLMRIKILTHNGATLKDLWDSVSFAILHATLTEPDGSGRREKIVLEVDRAATKAFTRPLANGLTFVQTSGFRTAYWISDPQGNKSGSTSLELMAQLHLCDCVNALLNRMPEQESSAAASALLFTALTRYRIAKIGLAELPPSLCYVNPDEKIIRSLLTDHKADPNRLSPERSTAWDHFIRDIARAPGSAWEETAKAFIVAGADPHHKGLNTSHMSKDLKKLLKQRRGSRWDVLTVRASGKKNGTGASNNMV